MGRKIQFKRGLKQNLPDLLLAEIAMTTDTNEVYIGSHSGNIGLATVDVVEDVSEKITITSKNISDLGINVDNFNTVGDGVTNDINAFKQAISFASLQNRPLFIPNKRYYIDGDLTINTDIVCNGVLIIPNDGLGKIKIDRVEKPVTIPATSLTGLSKNSVKVTGLNGNTGTLLLESKEVMIERTSGNPYTKKEVSEILDSSGSILPPLDQTYNDLENLTVTIFPKEVPLTVTGLSIELVGDSTSNRDHILGVYRSDVTFFGLDIINKSLTSNPKQGARVQNATNTTFNNPIIKGFRDPISGYGISLYNTAYTTINLGKINDSRHCISGLSNKQIFIKGGFYQSNISATFDSHWGNGFYVEDVDSLIANSAVNHIVFAGSNVGIKRSRFYGGSNVFGIRNDTPEMGEDLLIEDIDWETDVPLAFFAGFSTTSPLNFSFTSPLNNPNLVRIKDIRVKCPSTTSVVILYIADRRYRQYHWGKIFITNIAAQTAKLLRVFVGEKNTNYFVDINTTKIRIADIDFPTAEDQSLIINDGSSVADNTKGYDVIIKNCTNLFWNASQSSCITVLLDNCVITNFKRTGNGQGYLGDYTIMNSKLINTAFSGFMRINFKSCTFQGVITSADIDINVRTISSHGNVVKTGSSGYPINLDNYKDTAYYI